MKKRFATMLLLVMMILGCVPISASTAKAAACNHACGGQWKVYKEPTCTAKGSKIWVCKNCGAQIYGSPTMSIDALGHKIETVVTKKATCATRGEYVTKCTRKGCNYCAQNGHGYLPTTDNHLFVVESASASNCTTAGKVVLKCITCGKRKTEVSSIAPNEHNFFVTREGNTVHYSCNRCHLEKDHVSSSDFVAAFHTNYSALTKAEQDNIHLLWLRYNIKTFNSFSDSELLEIVNGKSFQVPKTNNNSNLITQASELRNRADFFFKNLKYAGTLATSIEKGGKLFVFDRPEFAGATKAVLWTVKNAGKMWGAYRLIDANLNGNWQDVYNAAVYFVSTVVPGGGIIASAPVDIANKIAIIGQCYYKAIDEADWDTHVNAVFGKSDNSLTLEDFGSNPEAKIRDLLSRYALIDDCYGEANYYNLLNNPSKLSSDKRTKAAKVFELYFGVLNNSMKTVTYNRNTFNWQ